MVWDGVDLVEISGVDMRIIFVLFASRIVSNVDELIVEVIGVSRAMLVISTVPDCSSGVLAGCEGVASFDVLNAFCC
jgi:hypothetical protein